MSVQIQLPPDQGSPIIGDHGSQQELLREIKTCILKYQTLYTESDILNLYVFGSRVYGTSNEQSDFDVICVVRDECFQVQVNRENSEATTTSVSAHLRKTGFVQCFAEKLSVQLDITLYSKSYFLNKLNDYCVHELTLIWLPQQFRLQEQFSLLEDWKDLDSEGVPVIQLAKLRKTISSQTNSVWKVSKKWFEEAVKKASESPVDDANGSDQHEINAPVWTDDLMKAKKGFIHCLRMFQFATQIAKKGKIENFDCANEYMLHPWIRDSSMTDLDKFHGHFRPIMVKFHHEFGDAAPKTK